MSRQFNTDGLMVLPSDNGNPITLNAFESIECTIAFDVRDWHEDRRSAWIYSIVFGVEDSWDEVAKKFGWDEEDRKRANMMHEQWIKAKETKDQDPRVMTLDEIKDGESYWLSAGKEFVPRPVICVHREDDAQKQYITFAWQFGTFSFESEDYDKTWRCWTAKPTNDQIREVVKLYED